MKCLWREWLTRCLDGRAPGECWDDSPMHHDKNGYPTVRVAGRNTKLGHLAMSAAGRPRPPAPANNMLHNCDNPRCANPHHLRWGTHAENVQDAVLRGRRGVSRGEANGAAKVTDKEVAEIRSRALAGETQRQIARDYSISRSNVSYIANHKSRSNA